MEKRTFGSIAGLVVVGEPAEVQVFHPWHPLLVLVVVCFLCPLHCEICVGNKAVELEVILAGYAGHSMTPSTLYTYTTSPR
jgi:hypothetical protein